MHPSPTTSLTPETLAAFAVDLAQAVRPIAQRWFRRPLEVDSKADQSPVTIADREIEQALRQRIAERFPQHGILGEEFGLAHGEAEYVWSIDPIDGTRSFISGYPLWGTLLALLHHGEPMLGVIDVPMLNECWVGARSFGTRLNGQPCHTGTREQLADATLYATTPDIFNPAELAVFDALSHRVGMRRFGGDCYSYALLASGHVDLVMEAGLQAYDYLALAPVIEGAGGVITDWQGRALTMRSGSQVLAAANLELHRQALDAIRAASPG
ncbi:MAG: histidinol-phosphatase [Burkholderiales bacterium]|nr:histidinol-phosphatase [Burkholderiales bacterium]